MHADGSDMAVRAQTPHRLLYVFLSVTITFIHGMSAILIISKREMSLYLTIPVHLPSDDSDRVCELTRTRCGMV